MSHGLLREMSEWVDYCMELKDMLRVRTTLLWVSLIVNVILGATLLWVQL